MPITKPLSSKVRAPQRANGIRRRETILNAAAAIISEAGIAGLTLHATARRAKSSIGSMYHFFSDKDELLETLREKHRACMNDMMENVVAINTGEWQKMSASEVIESLFGKPIRYYSDNPFALELHQIHEGQAVDTFLELLESVITLRLGELRGQKVAKVLYAISTGTLSFALDVRDTRQRPIITEIPYVLKAYLASQEAIDE